MQIVGVVIHYALYIYMYILIARMILSWVTVLSPGWSPKGPVLVIANIIFDITDPPLKFLRRWLKPVRIGQFALDLSFMGLFLLVIIAMRLNVAFFF